MTINATAARPIRFGARLGATITTTPRSTLGERMGQPNHDAMITLCRALVEFLALAGT